mgnify:CR=1 FL=1
MKFNSTSKTPGVKQEEKLFENIIDNLGKPKVSNKVRPKVRTETMSERTERITYEFDENNVKPKHLDNPLIVSQEDMTNRNLRPKQFDNLDPSSYPSNPKQKKALTTWEIMVDQAKNPKDQYDRESAKQVRQTILDSWKKPTMRKYLGDDELRLIGKHKDQQKKYEIPKVETPVYIEPIRVTPVPKASDYIKKQSVIEPGLSEDFMSLHKEIKKNMDYVMGKDQKEESTERSENDNNYKGDHDR